MNIRFIEAPHKYKAQIVEFLDECQVAGDIIVPFEKDKFDFDSFCQWIDTRSRIAKGDRVPSTMLFVLDVERKRIVGVVDIRHYLNDRYLHHSGHIGNIVRPSERRKGYATAQIALALQKCKGLGIDRVLITCESWNIGSAKSIINNGGVLENEVEFNGKAFQRYWIDNN